MNDVLITASPWVAGTHPKFYHATVSVQRTAKGVSWEEAVDAVLEEAAERARALQCNAIVGVEVHCDPYASDGGRIELIGTPACLQSLWGDFVAGENWNGLWR